MTNRRTFLWEIDALQFMAIKAPFAMMQEITNGYEVRWRDR